MADAHRPFVFVNRTINPLVRTLLRSPAHGLVSGRLMLLRVTGRKSGRRFTFPVGYHEDGNRITVTLDWPERKLWWRNLRGEGAPVEVDLHGVRRTGFARARGDEHEGVVVEIDLD